MTDPARDEAGPDARPWESPVLLVAAITVLGALLRVYHLGFRSLWYDEAVLYWISQGSLGEVISENAARNANPPLYALIVHFVSMLGRSEAVLRSASCLAGIAAVPAAYWLARQFAGRPASYFCAFVVAVAQQQVRYSQQLREYSMVFLLAIVILALYARYVREPGWRTALPLVPCWVVALFLNYGLALFILALNVALAGELVLRRKLSLAPAWAAVQLVGLAAVPAVYHLALKHQWQAGGFGADRYLAAGYWQGTAESLARLAGPGTQEIFEFAFFAPFLLAFLCLVGGVWALKEPRGRTALLMLLCPFAVTFAAACLRLYPYLGRRQTIFLTPMLYVFASLGWERISAGGRRRTVALCLVAMFGLVGLGTTGVFLHRTGRNHMRPVAARLADLIEPADRVYVYRAAVPSFRYYFRDDMSNVLPGGRWDEEGEEARRLSELLRGGGRVWLVFSRDAERDRAPVLELARESRDVELVAGRGQALLYVAR